MGNTEEKHVLFVCTGNTCRSPMAEAIFRYESHRRGLPVTVSSAGTAAAEQVGMKAGMLVGTLFPLVAVAVYIYIIKNWKKDTK